MCLCTHTPCLRSRRTLRSLLFSLPPPPPFFLFSLFSFTPYSGAHGVLAAALVALKQVTPDSEVTLLGSIKFRVKQLPAAYAAAALVWAAVTGTILHTVPCVLASTLAGWLYLRLLQPRPGAGDFRGDPSPEFAFATLFPAPLAPAVERVVDAAARVTGLAAAAPTVLSADVLGAPVLSEEAARRRERGARALEERLKTKQQKQGEGGEGGGEEGESAV